MNLVEESAKLRSDELREKNGSETAETMASWGETKVEFEDALGREQPSGINSRFEAGGRDRFLEERGSVSPAEAVSFSPEPVSANGDPVGGVYLAKSPLNLIESSSSAVAETSVSKSPPAKGYGLKKWKRIIRDPSKNVASNVDSSQILKRRHPLPEQPKVHDDSKHKSDGDCDLDDEGEAEGEGDAEGEVEGSVASLVSMNIGGVPPVAAPTTLDPELGLLVTSTGFNIGIDSENSDDHSSKSSTAASAPRLRYELIGFGRDRSRTRNVGGKGSGHVVQQRGQRAKGRIDVGKKFRESQMKIKIENSYSSVESDLRSSNMAALNMGSTASNGKQSEKSVNYDAEYSEDAHPNEEIKSSFYKENGMVDLLREELDTNQSEEENNDNDDNNSSLPDLDPFLESIVSLEATKDALEREIQNFREITKNTLLDEGDSQYEEAEGISSLEVEGNFTELIQKIEHLKCKLEEAVGDVKAKESKILELEEILDMTERPRKQTENHNLSFLEEKCKEMQIQLEDMLEKKIEAEIEYMITKGTTQNWKVLAEDHVVLLEEQKYLSGDQSELFLKVKNAENKAIILNEQAKKLENDLVRTKEVLSLQSRVYKYTLCCFVQAVILFIAFGFFLVHILPSSNELTPT